MFILYIVLSTTAKTWDQPRSPPTHELINMMHMCNAVLVTHKKNELLCGDMTSLEYTLSNEMSDPERLIVCVFTSTQKL